ncbi:MAG: cell division protein ZapB [Candidatus Krumholzibacteriia bacterium]|nr:cell division protein ZapB [bacterium]MCB9515098.1 cell division protein ZapB [Candidatus Latescibacterota bacterium]
MSEVSNLDILEQKIGQAIEKLNRMDRENHELRTRLEQLEQEKQGLASERDTLAAQLSSAQQSGANLDDLRGRVDGILSKFELLDL